MKTTLFILTFLFAFVAVEAQYSYNVVNSEPENKRIEEMAVDNNGNSILTGVFEGTLHFGSYTVNYDNDLNNLNASYIAKMNRDGSYAWVKCFKPESFFSQGIVDIKGISTDANGNIYMTGTFREKIIFDTVTLTSKESGQNFTSDIFTAKMDSEGALLWIKQEGSNLYACNGPEIGSSVVSDNIGNVFMAGTIVNQIWQNTTACSGLCPNNPTDKPQNCGYIVKYNSAGTKLFELKYLNSLEDANSTCSPNVSCSNIITDGSNIYVTGTFIGLVQFGSVSLNSGSVANTFLLKLDSSGSTIWAKAVTGSSNNIYGTNNLFLHPGSNDLYLSGVFFNGNISIGTCTLNTTESGGFMFKLDSSGNCSWGQKLGGVCYGSALHPKGNLIMLMRNDKYAGNVLSFVLKEVALSDGTTTDSLLFVKLNANTYFIHWGGMAQTDDGFVFTQMLNGSYELDSSLISSETQIGGPQDLMLIRYTSNITSVENQINSSSGRNATSGFSLYPNPACNNITLRSLNNKILGEVVIYDVTGRSVYKNCIYNSSASINIMNLADGFYFVRADQKSIVKFIKQ